MNAYCPRNYDLHMQMDHNNVKAHPVLSGGKMIVVNVKDLLSRAVRGADRQRSNFTNLYFGGTVKDGTIIARVGNEVKKQLVRDQKRCFTRQT